MLVSKEDNFSWILRVKTSNILLDNGSKVESPKEHEFVCCQNELSKTCLGMTISEFWPKISVLLTARKKSSEGEKMKATTAKLKGESSTAKQDTVVLSVSTGRQRTVSTGRQRTVSTGNQCTVSKGSLKRGKPKEKSTEMLAKEATRAIKDKERDWLLRG